ncbi:MAG: amidohydrolase family protein [Candidatus Hermodarchaeota archaeon]
MYSSEIFSNYGLIGDNLELKKDIKILISENGNFKSISYKNVGDTIQLSDNNSNLLLVPGLINSHIHIGDSFAKEQGFNKALKQVIAPPNGIKHLLLNKTPKEEIIKGIKKSILELLSNGITSFIDFREGGVDGLKILYEAIEREKIIKSLVLGRYREREEIKKIFQLADGIGLPSYKAISPKVKEILRKCKEVSGKIVACHVAELERDNDLINQIFNDNIVDIFIHGTHFIKNDLKLLEQKQSSIILCPRCNGYFGAGFPPINKILKLKISLAIGTDNVMANSPDLFEELRYLYRILRVMDRNITITGKDLLKMVTINAAKIFNIEGQIGSISEGKNANFFIIDLNNPNYYAQKLDIDTFYALIIGRTNSFNIKKTYVRGKLVHEKR